MALVLNQTTTRRTTTPATPAPAPVNSTMSSAARAYQTSTPSTPSVAAPTITPPRTNAPTTPTPQYDFSNDGLLGTQAMLQQRGYAPVSGTNQAEVNQGINRNVQTALADMMRQVTAQSSLNPSYVPPSSTPTPAPTSAGSPSSPTATGQTRTAPVPTQTATPASMAETARTFKPEVVAGYRDENGIYHPAQLTRPVEWSSVEERILQDKQRELSSIQNMNADPTIRAQMAYRAEQLQADINDMTARKQRTSPSTPTAGMNDQEYLSYTLRNMIDENGVLDPNSAAARVMQLNQEQEYYDKLKRETMISEGEQQRLTRELGNDRNKLIQQLASRGISVQNDAYGQEQMRDLERHYAGLASAENMRYVNATSAISDAQKAEREKQINKAIEDRKAAIAQMIQVAGVQQKKETAEAGIDFKYAKLKADIENQLGRRLNDQEELELKREIAQGTVEGVATVDSRKTAVAEAKAPSEIAENQAQAANANANAAFTSGAKTDLTKAQTTKITTLLPAQLKKLEADTAKVWAQTRKTTSGGSGSGAIVNGGAPTADEILAAANMHASTGKKGVPTAKQTADYVRLLRAAGGVSSASGTTYEIQQGQRTSNQVNDLYSPMPKPPVAPTAPTAPRTVAPAAPTPTPAPATSAPASTYNWRNYVR